MKKNTLKNNHGIAMAMTLMFSSVLFIIGGVFLLRVTHENRMTNKELDLQKTFYAAQAGSHLALSRLNTFINSYLYNTVANANPNSIIHYTKQKVNQGRSIEWLVNSTRDYDDEGEFEFVFTHNDEQAEYSASGTINNLNYEYDIFITENGKAYTAGSDAWDFPFFFKIISTASSGSLDQGVYLSGNFTVRVQRDNFAKYALFTNQQSTENGITVWFTDKTNFTGPVHTNDRFNFALNPSGTFDGIATQQNQWARFYNNNSPVLLDADFNSTRDVPVFNAGFTRGVNTISLTSPVQQADMIKQAKGGKNINTNGIHLPVNGSILCGGIYVRGNGTISLSIDGENPVYTISQGATIKRITIDYTQNQTRVENLSGGGPPLQTYQGLPHGQDAVGTLIFVDGAINSLSGTVQSNEQITIASSNDMIITNHVRYQSFNPGSGAPGNPGYIPPSANDMINLLGLISWGGHVRIGTTAPNNIDIHGTVLTKEGVFRVDSYDNTSMGSRGTATLLGGMISDKYGAFGQFSGATGQHISGYGRNFVYDNRMLLGSAPPYFPTLEAFIAFTNDLTDKLIWQKKGE